MLHRMWFPCWERVFFLVIHILLLQFYCYIPKLHILNISPISIAWYCYTYLKYNIMSSILLLMSIYIVLSSVLCTVFNYYLLVCVLFVFQHIQFHIFAWLLRKPGIVLILDKIAAIFNYVLQIQVNVMHIMVSSVWDTHALFSIYMVL